jgi:inner membrane protein
MENQENLFKRITTSVSFKLAVIAFLTLLLLIPTFMIQNLIREREQRHDETINEVTSKWGNAQSLSGPILTIPYKIWLQSEKGMVFQMHHMHILPASLDISGKIYPEVRYRGIYKVIAYRAGLSFQGKFDTVDLNALSINPDDVEWDQATIEVGIPDMRGINKTISIIWDGKTLPVTPGIPKENVNPSGIHTRVAVNETGTHTFSFSMDINGSHSLNFIPLGGETNVSLSSDWKNPSFTGAFLPDDRNMTDTGFTAQWNVLQLNRNYPQQWTDHDYQTEDSAFGVDLITLVDNYQKSMRSAKYAILFIVLTFMVLFFAEIIRKTSIHPIQYLLVGVALCVFYTLLTSLSEHIGFALSYLIAAMVIIILISLFVRSLYKNTKVTLSVAALLAALYVYLYVILQLTDYALLIGSIGLVIVLAIVMYFSHKIDWYSTTRIKNTDSR